jgi:hypothetical protein
MYKELMEVFYTALQDPSPSANKAAYTFRPEKHPTDRPNIDSNNLANVKRYRETKEMNTSRTFNNPRKDQT